MCGIAGFFNFPTQEIPAEHLLKRMLALIRHRGPDESGIYLNDQVAVGSVRLSIIDIATGQQPLSDASGRYWIVFNGEIFNYVELRKELLDAGHELRTKSDTEVVVQMYALYGEKCLSRFNGQFAICIWDKEKKELFLARDRMGIRPLFFWNRGGSFAFCSEIKGLFSLPWIERSIRPESLSEIFTYWTTLSPYTPFQGILELPPAHYMKVNSSGVSVNRFWRLDFVPEKEIRPRQLNETAEEFTALLKDAVRVRLRADVPVAAYLSGGLDSTATTSLIHELEPGVLNTYSIGFEEGEFDEKRYQDEASAYFHTRHQAYTCTTEDIARSFPQTIWHSEFPILRTAPTPMMLLSSKVREDGIKVVVTGEGADEILGGYNIFKEARIRRFWAKDPASKYRPLLLGKLYPYLKSMKGMNNTMLKMFYGYRLADTNDPLYSHLIRWHNTSRISSYLNPDLASKISGYDPLAGLYPSLPENFMEWGDLSRSQYLEATIFMSGYLLSSQGDRMAMGNSVEGRYPFLDYRLIEFCASLPENFRLNGLDEKYLLKKAMTGKIPESIRSRVKQPYRAPIASTFLGKSEPEYVAGLLSDHELVKAGLFDSARVSVLLKKVRSGQSYSEVDLMAVTALISTQLLVHQFIHANMPDETGLLPSCRVIKEN